MGDTSVVVFERGDIKITAEEQETFVEFLSAQNPTPAELKLHYFFCADKGVHPLTRLIYFTKRGGKYTPITSIDYLRIRAESSGLYAGSDDAAFKGEVKKDNKTYPLSATVTVWKLVNGQRCPFTGTARWSEYAPANLNDNNAFMWKSKPYIMLSKCAEALALRKGFPGQLQGLYISEEYDASAPVVNYPVNASHGKNGEKASEIIVEGEATSVAEAVPTEPHEAVRISWFDGSEKSAEALIDKRNIDAFIKKFVGDNLPFAAIAHLKNHLRKHFHVDTLAELTWEKFGALINHVKNGVDDPRWYTEEEVAKAEVNESTQNAEGLGASVNLDELVQKWQDNKSTTFAELEVGLQERVRDMLALVDAEAIKPDDYAAMIEVLDA